jgi:hypothetical protein
MFWSQVVLGLFAAKIKTRTSETIGWKTWNIPICPFPHYCLISLIKILIIAEMQISAKAIITIQRNSSYGLMSTFSFSISKLPDFWLYFQIDNMFFHINELKPLVF